jgi:3-oxoacyl-[acyl-carrier protein] reductase
MWLLFRDDGWLPVELELDGKRCLITGASKGCGHGSAVALAREGCELALVARRLGPLDEVAGEIVGMGLARPSVIQADVTAPGAASMIREAAVSAMGGVDVLVNAAGGSRPAAWDVPAAEWEEGMQVNFDAVRDISTALVPQMRERGWGRIINITGSNEPPSLNIACVAKAAVHSWSKGLSNALGLDGITVNCVQPGVIRSEQIEMRLFPNSQALDQFIEEWVPLGYIGEPEDIASLITFLASPKARYITGAVIPVDGGKRNYPF